MKPVSSVAGAATHADTPASHAEKQRIIRLYYAFQFTFTLLFWIPVFFEYQKRMGLSEPEIFRIQSLYYVAFCLLELPTGYLADRFGYRRSLIVGAITLIGANVLAVYAASFNAFLWHWLLIAAARSFVSGASTAYLFDYLRKKNAHLEFKQIEGNARAYSLFGRVFCFAVIGYLMAWKITLPYWLTVAAAALSLVFAIALPVAGGSAPSSRTKVPLRAALERALRSPWLLALMFQGIVIFVLARVITVNLFQPILGTKGFSIEAYGLVMGGVTLAEALGSAKPNWMRRWFSVVNSVFILSAAMGLCVAALPYFGGVGTLVIFTLFSLATGLSYPIQKQVMNEAIPDPDYRATILSMESLIDRAVTAGVAAVLEHTVDRMGGFLIWVGLGSVALMVCVQICLNRLGSGRAEASETRAY